MWNLFLKYIRISLIFCILIIPSIIIGQVSESKIKALYIYQIAQQIEWKNHDQISNYKFGIISEDTILQYFGRF
ncbi:MAG: hypothetical protein JEZ09_03195 [Salinivirgaceae bacterium]|nr:hypothetical protein [Salinivirgaceae bacterium]